MKRKSTGKRLRFEIFARDGFRCRYCGRQSDQVELVLDHVEPVSKGGETTPENLITSCFDCNAGKADRKLNQFIPTVEDALARHQLMREQQRALAVAKETAASRKEEYQAIVNYVCEAYKIESVNKRNIGVLVYFFRQHGPIVFEWIDIAVERVKESKVSRYVSGIRRRWMEEQEGAAV